MSSPSSPSKFQPNGHGLVRQGSISPMEKKLQLRPKRTRRPGATLSSVFIGLALRIHNDRIEYAVVIHDGMGIVGSERDVHMRPGHVQDDCDRHRVLIGKLLKRAKEYSQARGHTIPIFAVAGPVDPPLDIVPSSFDVDRSNGSTFATRLWLELDTIPIFVPCRETQFSLEGEATRAVEEALTWLHPTTTRIIEATTSEHRKEVQVDANGLVRVYDLSQQAALTSPDLWNKFTSLGKKLQNKNVRISFFSATPRGGGVALMRHALIRLWRLAGLNVKWYVPQGDSAVFDITKRKFHNVLQGVAPPEIELKDEDKSLYERWIKWNYERFFDCTKEDTCPTTADIVVIDDPQLSGLIPYIRQHSPSTKIIYRSHIEIRSDLINSKKSPQSEVWEYLWGFIRHADLFISHPIKEFVPQEVARSMPVVYMPPCTDPLDGLNKPLSEDAMKVYHHMMQEILSGSTGQKVDWSRGYIIQVARFDPSKGIPYLLEGYRIFREAFKKTKEGVGVGRDTPQLILIGNTSVDDPDASHVLHHVQEMVATDEFAEFKDDIFAVRAPPEDRLLNTLLRGADVACQVSTREGFEIKVTEAIHKKRWIIGTNAGGIPLQIRDGVDGTVVPPADAEAIGKALLDYYTKHGCRKSNMTADVECGQGENYEKANVEEEEVGAEDDNTDVEVDGRDEEGDIKNVGLKRASTANNPEVPLGGRWTTEGAGPKEELFTVGNATMWQFLWCTMLGLIPPISPSTTKSKTTPSNMISKLTSKLRLTSTPSLGKAGVNEAHTKGDGGQGSEESKPSPLSLLDQYSVWDALQLAQV